MGLISVRRGGGRARCNVIILIGCFGTGLTCSAWLGFGTAVLNEGKPIAARVAGRHGMRAAAGNFTMATSPNGRDAKWREHLWQLEQRLTTNGCEFKLSGTRPIPPALWATGGLAVVFGKITPLPTFSPGLRSGPSGSVADEHRFRQTLRIAQRAPSKVRGCCPLPSYFPLLSYSCCGFCRADRKR